MVDEVMDAHFLLFNLHVNDAQAKADAAFIKRFGQQAYDELIAPLHESGIMEITTGRWKTCIVSGTSKPFAST